MRSRPLPILKRPPRISFRPLHFLNGPLGILKRPLPILNGPLRILKRPLGFLNRPLPILNRPPGILKRPLRISDRSPFLRSRPPRILKRPLEIADRHDFSRSHRERVPHNLEHLFAGTHHRQEPCLLLMTIDYDVDEGDFTPARKADSTREAQPTDNRQRAKRSYCSFIDSTRTLLGSARVKRLCSTGSFVLIFVNS